MNNSIRRTEIFSQNGIALSALDRLYCIAIQMLWSKNDFCLIINSVYFTEQDATMDDISDEVILNIFSYLPRVSIVKCLQVNRRWNRIG